MPSQAQQALFSLVEIATAAEEGKASRGGAGREGSSARLRLVLTTREPSKVILALRKSVKLLEVDRPNPRPRFTHAGPCGWYFFHCPYLWYIYQSILCSYLRRTSRREEVSRGRRHTIVVVMAMGSAERTLRKVALEEIGTTHIFEHLLL